MAGLAITTKKSKLCASAWLGSRCQWTVYCLSTFYLPLQRAWGNRRKRNLEQIWCNEALRVPKAFVSMHGLIFTLER